MSQPAPFTFRHPMRVRWAETDPQGVVFNANYFLYFDVTVTEYWRAVGLRYPEDFHGAGLDCFAVKATAEFRAPARYDDMIDVACRVARIGRSSMQILLAIHRQETLLVEGELVYVATDLANRQPVRWADTIREAIRRFEVTPPDETDPPK